MRFPLIPALLMMALCCALDYYIYSRLKRSGLNPVWRKIQLWSGIVLQLFIVALIALPKRHGADGELLFIMWGLYFYISVYTSKLLFVIIDLIGRLPQLFKRKSLKGFGPAGVVVAVIAFGVMWWGALINRFNIQINEVEVSDRALPAAFDGFRIVQISDLHVGTFGSDTSFVSEMVSRINALNPDMIVFTGDIVNRHTPELKPFIGVLSRLHAPYGVWSILGNHDYGDYYEWYHPSQKAENRRQLIDYQRQMGWNLMLNQTETIHRGSDSIKLIGVENVGDPPFRNYGDLLKAYTTPEDSQYKILLTHNPAHWTAKIQDKGGQNINLTMSGHTHAMQMSIGHFSPSVWRYPTWGGLYHDSMGRKLYVNIGMGTVGMPMRIGATPEITVLTLKK